MSLKSFGEMIKSFREKRKLPLRVVAKVVDIDISTLGKIEKNERSPSESLIKKLAIYFNINEKDLYIASKSDNVAYKLMEEEDAIEILRAAEEKVKYIIKDKHKNL